LWLIIFGEHYVTFFLSSSLITCFVISQLNANYDGVIWLGKTGISPRSPSKPITGLKTKKDKIKWVKPNKIK
jgi:hypothetical protein